MNISSAGHISLSMDSTFKLCVHALKRLYHKTVLAFGHVWTYLSLNLCNSWLLNFFYDPPILNTTNIILWFMRTLLHF
jgi:hypothetical protein